MTEHLRVLIGVFLLAAIPAAATYLILVALGR